MTHKNPGATVDLILIRKEYILLIQRKDEPHKSEWALPGGFLEYGKENLEQAGVRELKEETGLITNPLNLKQIGFMSNPDRDPREHVISHIFYVDEFSEELKAGDDANDARWFDLKNLPKLAFDHSEIINKYLSWKKKNGK